jgi:4'-phosphopantetheinyl transferase
VTQHCARMPSLHGDAVHVWVAHLDPRREPIERAAETLDEEERARAGRFHAEIVRTRFVLAHGFLRELLGRYLNVRPRRLAFTRDVHGKPGLAGNELHFNLSHSSALAMAGISARARVGVDVEQIRPLPNLLALAKGVLAAREFDLLLAASPDQRTRAFFTYWTRKEAVVKCSGKGLSIPLDSFDTSLACRSLRSGAAQCLEASVALRCCLSDLPAADGYASAVAVDGRTARVSCWRWA